MNFRRAIIFDLDGTAIPNQASGMPSKKVIEMVRSLKDEYLVTFATGRPLAACRAIAEALGISLHCVVTGGAEVVKPDSTARLYYQPFEDIQLEGLAAILSEYEYHFLTESSSLPLSCKHPQLSSPLLHVCVLGVTAGDAASLTTRVHTLDSVLVHQVNSWTTGRFDLHISHALATKRHGLESLLAHYGLYPDQTLAVGDGGNDLPMFEVAGLAIAMGNATNPLKAAADWIAPSVEEDGLVAAVEYALNSEWGRG